MKRRVLLFGLVGGLLIAALKWMEYRFLVIEHSLEIYGGLIAATFAVLGIWLGLKRQATHPGGSTGERTPPDPMNRSPKRMIFRRKPQNHPKE